MNAARRKKLEAIRSTIDDLKSKLEIARDEIDTELQDEQSTYDNMPESFQNGERGETAQAALDHLQSAYDTLDNACDSISEAYDSLEEAKGGN